MTRKEVDNCDNEEPLRLMGEVSSDAEMGLLLTWSEEDNACRATFVKDRALPEINPNAHVPAALTSEKLLHGGGSGVTVFSGILTSPCLSESREQNIVMKHGGPKDMGELFALATIARQLVIRSSRSGELNDVIVTSAHAMKARIPDFRMIYISPHHLVDRGAKLWHNLRSTFKAISLLRDHDNTLKFYHSDSVDSITSSWDNSSHISSDSATDSTRTDSINSNVVNKNRERSIHITTPRKVSARNTSEVKVNKERMDIQFHPDSKRVIDQDGQAWVHYGGDGYEMFKSIVFQLQALQKDHFWKFTLGQRTIGEGSHPTTGSSLLTDGKLHGALLQTLITEFERVIRDLQFLTLEEEMNEPLQRVQMDLRHWEQQSIAASDGKELALEHVSVSMDAFVGFAIHKNFDPKRGRFQRLRKMGCKFRHCCGESMADTCNDMEEEGLLLTEEEIAPANLLGDLLKPGCLIRNLFVVDTDESSDATALDAISDSWRDILYHAAFEVKGPAATSCIWTCGLTDAGLHNLFLSPTNLSLFDLGTPSLQPIPAFLTKFLMSFFHALGMQDYPVDEDGTNRNDWVKRFEAVPDDSEKFRLTAETAVLLVKSYDAFKITLDRFILSMFDGEQAVRSLLIKYVILQLISDAAFCLERWEMKGGGSKKLQGVPHQQHGLERWLWRALWDLYVASDIHTQQATL
uniref:Uncharacterized protein n=1 Tax=Attheya septentrionalis TaxID=420275 RepID=A0A7S2XL92_9STRA|mmetsp:Transcript_17796/g.32217  ORF Transcript_17796/g.32217 Transcript_17796/m.32217 type:complete len:691 (+) Transcript_17796:173-2245(+)